MEVSFSMKMMGKGRGLCHTFVVECLSSGIGVSMAFYVKCCPCVVHDECIDFVFLKNSIDCMAFYDFFSIKIFFYRFCFIKFVL